MIHYQIQRKGEDALFTLSEGKKISHGLDSLVDYYMKGKETGLQHTLTDWVPGIGDVLISILGAKVDFEYFICGCKTVLQLINCRQPGPS